MIRPMEPSDRALCANSWLRSYEGSIYAGGLHPQQYRNTWTPIVDELLSRCRVDVFYNPEDESQVFGWACYETRSDGLPVLHYVYVKSLFRDAKERAPGIAKALIAPVIVVGLVTDNFAYTFKTIAWSRYMQKHRLYNGEYAPRMREAEKHG